MLRIGSARTCRLIASRVRPAWSETWPATSCALSFAWAPSLWPIAQACFAASSTWVRVSAAPAEALSEQVMADVFRISAYRAEYQREAVIVPWAEI